MKMKRRDFLSKSIKAGIVTGSALTFGGSKIMANNMSSSSYDLVAIKGATPEKMFDHGIAALGGMKKYVKPNQEVVVKPNIGWDAPPERAADTNPGLVGRIVKHCIRAGAKKVYVFDNTCNEWTKSYKNSGIEKAAKDAGAQVVSGDSKKYYHQVSIPKGDKLNTVQVHELILDTDVFINVPILKHHSSTSLTISMKNLMGAIWDRRYWHEHNLHKCIAEFPTWKQPDLNVVDAYNVLKRNGPRGVSVKDVVNMKYQIISDDIVAADAAAAKLFGKEPESIGHIKYAHEMGVGNMNLSEQNIKRIAL